MKKLVFLLLAASTMVVAQDLSTVFEPIDIFDLEFVANPQISPDGENVLYTRMYKDIMTDANLSNLWMVDFNGENHQPVTNGAHNDSAPRWSPDGRSFVYRSNKSGSSQLYIYRLNDDVEIQLTNLAHGFATPYWSPDGQWIAFTMGVPYDEPSLFKLPKKPEGAKWNDPPVVINKMKYRSDGSGYVKNQYQQIFLLTTQGGTPIQLTNDPYNHSSQLAWAADGKSIYYSANGHDDRAHSPRNSEIYQLDIDTRTSKQITQRQGPDGAPVLSPEGDRIAYLGYDDELQGYQVTRLYVMNTDGSLAQCISCNFDRDVGNVRWAKDGQSFFFQYDEHGNTKLARMSLQGEVTKLADDLGGMSLGRPYSGGTYSVAANGRFAFTHSTPDHPSDLAVGLEGEVNRITDLNADLFKYKKLGEAEEIWYKSSYDQREIQGWIVKPPDFDASKKYPLILEIHGGPFANYGDRFSAEIQLYAAAGYVVLYTNPRGSTSYGQEFGNLIHHNYPSQDYDDLISGVDAVIDLGYVDENRLYVTGGSGGGVLSSWIIGKTNRFKAAVVAKPVINWYSFVLYADNPATFYKYWFPGKPWDHEAHYMKRSPISLVGNVQTPTMLLTGEADYRTPMAETEQYYAALQINGVESMMVRIPGAGHGIANKPSNLLAKVVYVLGWFDQYK